MAHAGCTREVQQRGSRLVRETGRGIFGVADGDFLEILDAPEIAVLTHGAEIEARHAERLRADFGIPAIEAAEVDVGRTVGEPTRFDGIQALCTYRGRRERLRRSLLLLKSRQRSIPHVHWLNNEYRFTRRKPSAPFPGPLAA